MKKFVSLAMVTVLSATTLASCTKNEAVEDSSADGKLLQVAMTTDAGYIDDKSFNQGTWEGILAYSNENAGTINTHYIKPSGESTADYLNAYADLVDAGYEVIFSPGFKFEEAVYEAQEMYPDVKFIIIDGYPHAGDWNPVIAENTESIFFAEQESGFYAGVVAALSSKTGKVGFIGGMEVDAVQKFGWGYTAGVAYANKNYGTDVVVDKYIYQGTFDDVVAGQTLAGAFYKDGVDIIFSAAAAVGIGVISEGKTRRSAGEDVWVIGVDVDQYEEGIIETGESVILTSAMKELGGSAYTTIDQILADEFKAGQMITFDSSNNGVGLPKENPNLSQDILDKYDEVYEKVATGEVLIPTSADELLEFLEKHDYNTPNGIKY